MGEAVFDREVFEWTNKVRAEPTCLNKALEDRLSKFDGTRVVMPDISILTQEGAPAVQEALEFLNKQKPLPTLEWSDALASASRDHCNDNGPHGKMGHCGMDNSTMQDRIARHTRQFPASGENIYYGEAEPWEKVLALIVDDGVPGRGHRSNIFHPHWTHAGSATGPHKDMKEMTTQNFGTDAESVERRMKAASKSLEEQVAAQEPEGWVGKQTAISQGKRDGVDVMTMRVAYQMPDGETEVVTVAKVLSE